MVCYEIIGSFWVALKKKVRKLIREVRTRAGAFDKQLTIESLEPRRLLALSPISFSVDSGRIRIEGTEGADSVVVSAETTSIRVQVVSVGNNNPEDNGIFEEQFPIAEVTLISFAGGDGDDHFLNQTDVIARATGDEGNDLLIGGDADDLLRGGNGNDRLVGGGGDDELIGGDGVDVLSGGAGNDLLEGEAGADQLFGGQGVDHLVGGPGDDQLSGEEGADLLRGEDDDDVIVGGPDNDQLWGGAGNDILFGLEGNDELRGHVGNDHLYGGEGNDLLFGDDGNDLMSGGAGEDELDASYGNDILIGGDGQDILEGKEGDDLLIGGRTTYSDGSSEYVALMSVWSNLPSYDARVDVIQDQHFWAGLRSEDSVFDDLVVDSVFGGSGQDWFFLPGVMSIYNPLAESHSHSTSMPDHDAGHSHHHNHYIYDSPPAVEGFALIDSLDDFVDIRDDERIHSALPHPEDTIKRNEHLGLFELVRYDQVTHTAVSSGDWSDASTWQDGVVPNDGARVLIPYGVEVVVDSVIPTRLATVRVDGVLSFAADKNSELRVDTLIGSGPSEIRMGTQHHPIQEDVVAKILITDDGPIDRTWDPFGISRGVITHGAVTIYGAQVASQVALAAPVSAGATTLTLDSVAEGWKVGDQIVIASAIAGAEQNEVREILAINGTELLVAPLDYDHIPPQTGIEVHVANLTRNVVIESENLTTDRRGHVMFMHNRDIDIHHAGFYGLGRSDKSTPVNDSVVESDWTLQPGSGTNARGRYAVHFHRNGLVSDGHPAVIQGSVVNDSPGWGFVNHSSYVNIVDNVAFDVRGAAFVTEAGNEIGSFRDNIAIGSTGSGEESDSRVALSDFGHQGDGFWFQGGGIAVIGNIAAGNEGSGFIYFTIALEENGERPEFPVENLYDPSIAEGYDSISVKSVPVLLFDDNIAYASSIGLNIQHHLIAAPHEVRSILSDSTFWNNTTAVDLRYVHQTTLSNLTVIHALTEEVETGIRTNAQTKDTNYINLTVIGYEIGVAERGYGNTLFFGGYYENRSNIVFRAPRVDARTALITGPIVFAEAPEELLNGKNQSNVIMQPSITERQGSLLHVFLRDIVVLDYGAFSSQRVYSVNQLADFVPFPVSVADIPIQLVGLTNQQIKDQFGVTLGGEIVPQDAITDSLIGGLIEPAS